MTTIRTKLQLGLWMMSAVLAATGSSAASAQEAPACGSDVKEAVAKALGEQVDLTSPESLKLQNELYAKYQVCAADGEELPAEVVSQLSREYCGKLTYLGSTYYERMRCCGYDPQKRTFGCPIEVKQPFGFGAAPFPGSREHVLSCVDLGAGYQPVALDSVHLANAVSGGPDWYFAVLARANEKLARQPLNGKTLRARSILSWGLVPQDCNYRPIWGNVIDYQIRLDP